MKTESQSYSMTTNWKVKVAIHYPTKNGRKRFILCNYNRPRAWKLILLTNVGSKDTSVLCVCVRECMHYTCASVHVCTHSHFLHNTNIKPKKTLKSTQDKRSYILPRDKLTIICKYKRYLVWNVDPSNNASCGYSCYAAVNDPIKITHLIPLSTNSTQLESPHINWTLGVRNPSEETWLFRATRFPLRTAHTSVHSFGPGNNDHTPYDPFLSSGQMERGLDTKHMYSDPNK
jgi:hypothetical protein